MSGLETYPDFYSALWLTHVSKQGIVETGPFFIPET